MMRKRLLCAISALILLFSAQPMAAAASTGNQRSTQITATCRLPIIKVAVPPRASTYINPLQFPVRIYGDGGDEQIISTPASLANYSEVPMAVDVTITGAIRAGSDMKLSSTSTKGTGSTEKKAFVYFEMQTANTDDTDQVEWDDTFDASKHLVVADGESVTKEGIVTLAARTLDGEVAEGGYAPFRLTGDAVAEPEKAWNSSKDGVAVAVAFTFTPQTYPNDA